MPNGKGLPLGFFVLVDYSAVVFINWTLSIYTDKLPVAGLLNCIKLEVVKLLTDILKEIQVLPSLFASVLEITPSNLVTLVEELSLSI